MTPPSDDDAVRTLDTLARALPADPCATFLPHQTGIIPPLSEADDAAAGDAAPVHSVADEAAATIPRLATNDAAPASQRAPEWTLVGQTVRRAAPGLAGADPLGTDGPPPPAYRMRRLRGQGGFGEVWEALQTSLGRIVAIKMLRHDLVDAATDAELAQHFVAFRAEAASAARLEHPHIVPVYDLGADASGTPMLAMKLVEGQAWDALLIDDIERLEPEELLARHLPHLVDMAQAVAFAHARGIVHRDLKPAQVMLGEFGEVLLMDWGLAVAMRGDLVPATADDAPILRTIPTPATASNPAGTPALMAPEQVRPDAATIGPWTDIFLLGGTLYYLLTGTYPYHTGSSLDRMKRALVGLIETPEERAPGRVIPPGLSALCRRALQPDPAARLGSVQEFIAGIDDYLTGASRRRESETLAAALRARLANAEGATRDYTFWSGCVSDAARARELWPANPGLGPVRAQIHEGYARAALAGGDLQLAALQARELDDPGGAGAALLAEIEAAAAALARAARQRRLAIAGSFALMALVVVGSVVFSFQLNSARREAERAEADAEARHRDAAQARDESTKRRREAEELFAFAITDLRKRLAEAGRIELLDEVAHRAQAYYIGRADEQLSAVDAVVLIERLLDLGSVFGVLGDQPRRLETYVAASELAEARREDPTWNVVYGIARSLLGGTLKNTGRATEAEAMIRESIAIMATLDAGTANNLRPLSYHLSRTFFDNARYLLERGETAASLAVTQQCVVRLRELLDRHPDDFQVRSDLGFLLFGHARALANAGRHEEALAALDEYEATQEYLLAHGARPETSFKDHGYAMELRGEIAIARGDVLAAEAALREAIAWKEKAVAATPLEPLARQSLVAARSELINLLRQAGRPAGTMEMAEANIREMEALVGRDPTNVDWAVGLATRILQRGYGYFEVGRDAEGDAAFAEACDRLRRLGEQFPDDLQIAESLPPWLLRHSASRLILGDGEGARTFMEEAVTRAEALGARKPDDAGTTVLRAEAHARRVWTLVMVGDVAAAEAAAGDMRACVASVAPLVESRNDARRRRADIAASEALLARALGNEAAMRAAVEEVLAFYPADAAADPARSVLLDLRAPIVALVVAGRLDEARPAIARLREGTVRDLLLEVFLVRHGLGQLWPGGAPPSGE